ncbi:MAG: hypothetical protein H0U73_12995 [Tatlockia sp.]|nr:hypothetical protein [Tatlockia sp.]
MDLKEFNQLIDLTSKVFFAEDKAAADRLWQDFEKAVLNVSEYNCYQLATETAEDTPTTRAKKFYQRWILHNYPECPNKQFNVAIGYGINCTFGTSFCLIDLAQTKENSSKKAEIDTQTFRKVYKACPKEQSSFFKTQVRDDLREIAPKPLDLHQDTFKCAG